MTITPLISLAAAGPALISAATGAIGQLPFADVLAGKTKEATAPKVANAEPLSVGDFESAGQNALAQFHALLMPKLAALGITLAQPLTLAVDAFGKIRETSGHPQGGDIEAAINGDDELGRHFRQASSQLELARAGREHAQFAKLYAANPELAVSQYSHLFDEHPARASFSALVSGQRATPAFH